MTLSHDIILTIHFLGLFMGGASAFGLPVIGAIAGKSEPEHRPAIGQAVKPLKMIGHIGLALLLVTGFILASTGNVWENTPLTFWLKLLGVILLLGGVYYAGKTGAKAMSGDADAAEKMPMLSMINIGLGVLIVLFAALTFH